MFLPPSQLPPPIDTAERTIVTHNTNYFSLPLAFSLFSSLFLSAARRWERVAAARLEFDVVMKPQQFDHQMMIDHHRLQHQLPFSAPSPSPSSKSPSPSPIAQPPIHSSPPPSQRSSFHHVSPSSAPCAEVTTYSCAQAPLLPPPSHPPFSTLVSR